MPSRWVFLLLTGVRVGSISIGVDSFDERVFPLSKKFFNLDIDDLYNMPPKDPVPVVADEGDDSYTKDNVTGFVACIASLLSPLTGCSDQGNTGKRSNPNRNVGGTA